MSKLIKFKKECDTTLRELVGSGITVYRGFSRECDREEIGEIFIGYDDLVSFTESKSTAIQIAKERCEDNDEYGYAIELYVPVSQIFFHWKLDNIGSHHPKEREVVICPYGLEWKIIKCFKPKR